MGDDLYMHFRKSYQNIPLFRILTTLVFILLVSTAQALDQNSYSDIRRSDPVSAKEYEAIGLEYTDALNKKDIQKLAKLFDMESFAYAAARTVFESKKEINGFVKGVLKRTEEQFLSQIFSAVFNREVKAKYLRLLENDQPLIRIDYTEGGHEYAILYLKRIAPGKIVVVDMFFLTSGQKLSVALGAASQLLLRPSKSILKRIFGKAEIDSKMLVAIRDIGKLRIAGKYKEAYDLITTLPEAIKKNRIVIDTSIQLAQYINDEEYRKQLTRLDKYYGQDETTTFILIDHYFFNGDYDKALLSMDRLIDRLGVDGALLNLKANAYYAAKKYTKAQEYARKAIQQEPSFEDAYWTLITTLTETGDYGGTILVLNQVEKKFGYKFKAEDFETNKIYDKFVKTSEFRTRFN